MGGVLDFLHLPPGNVLLLYGVRGIGKTSIGLGAFRRPWFVSSEMEASQVLQYSRRLGAALEGVSEVSQNEDGSWSLGIPPQVETRDLVLDSVSVSDPVALFGAVRELAVQGWRAVVTSQVTVEGAPRGGESVPHLSDVLVELSTDGPNRTLNVLKNRLGPEAGLIFELTAEGPVRPKWSHYYAVAGKPPSYRLVPYPFGKAPGFSVYQAAEQGELQIPAPPLAVSAMRSGLYGGWVEPPDLVQIQSFCERIKIKHWSPNGDRN